MAIHIHKLPENKIESPSGIINGANTDFELSASPLSNTLLVFLNGLLQEEGSGKDYVLSGTTITFLYAPESGDIIITVYQT